MSLITEKKMMEWFRLGLLVVLPLLIYVHTVDNELVFDDGVVTSNPALRITSLTPQVIADVIMNPLPTLRYRPVANLSFALNYYMTGDSVSSYRLTNIFIHITAAVFFYLLLSVTLTLPGIGEKERSSPWLPLIVALIWAVHPVQTQAVSYLVQRMTSLVGLFCLMSLYFYTLGRLAASTRGRFGFLFVSGFSALLALGSKENAVILPLLILLYERFFFRDLDWGWLRRTSGWILGCVLVLAGASILYLGSTPLTNLLAGYGERDFTLTERLLTESRVLWQYISLLILPLPSRLNLDYDFSLSHSLVDPLTTIPAIIGLVLMAVTAVFIVRKERLIAFGLFWFLLTLLIESTVVPLEIIFEHRLYLPSMFMMVVPVVVVSRLVADYRVRLTLVAVIVLLFSVWTYQRNFIWQNGLTLWTDCVQKSPGKARPHNNLGNALMKVGDYNGARREFQAALAIKPDIAETYNSIGILLYLTQKPDEAIGFFEKSLSLQKNNRGALFNLGNLMLEKGDLAAAKTYFREGTKVFPNDEKAFFYLGVVSERQGDFPGARDYYRKAIQLDPAYLAACNNLGILLATENRLIEARELFQAALRFHPEDSAARNNLDRVNKILRGQNL
ncbi:MAG: tetratricopeptide repeat protein [Proteobacteria bacterium]|nr:tetratricopeptide repeat protein [Pseudomonadota bacterium]MBU1688116.1 tetratricopeptide repeat protein [Pseudomonadota bacterium]